MILISLHGEYRPIATVLTVVSLSFAMAQSLQLLKLSLDLCLKLVHGIT